MPKAAVNENDGIKSFEHDIRTPRQIRVVQSKPISQTMEQPSYEEFGLGILGCHALHDR